MITRILIWGFLIHTLTHGVAYGQSNSPGGATFDIGGAVVNTLNEDSKSFYDDLHAIIPSEGLCISPNADQASIFTAEYGLLKDLYQLSAHYTWYHDLFYFEREIAYSRLPFIYLIEARDYKAMMVELLYNADIDNLSLVTYQGKKYGGRQFFLSSFLGEVFIVAFFKDAIISDPIIIMRQELLKRMTQDDLLDFYAELYVACTDIASL